MKLSRPVTVLAAAVILAGGAAVAVNATTGTDPVTLCSSTKNGAVTVPTSGGSCAKGTTPFDLAPGAAAEALGTRLSAAEADLGAANSRLAAAESQLAAQAAALTALDADFREFTPSTFEIGPPTMLGDVQWTVGATGVGLKPGAEVRLHSRMGQFPPSSSVVTTVRDDGTVTVSATLACTAHSVSFSTLTDGDDPIATNVVARGPAC